jgi:hypothetical protein
MILITTTRPMIDNDQYAPGYGMPNSSANTQCQPIMIQLTRK